MRLTKQLTAASLIAALTFAATSAPVLARADDETSTTVVQQKMNALVRLVPLRKMTVGPDDQYQGVATPDGKQLFFTRKSDLVPHLCVQDNDTGLAEPFLTMSADSQQPVLSGSGRVAFAYYRSHASGDICHRDISAKRGEDSGIECVEAGAADEGERSSPFWKSTNELGFLVRNPRTGVNRIYVQNLKDGKRTLVAEGGFWSPSMNPGGKWLVASESVSTASGNAERELSLIPMDDPLPFTGTPRRIRIALPGVSGFPVLSKDERFVYFSHYLNDTNGDGIIDGNDNSVLFRVRTDAAPSAGDKPVFPEQLTAAESDCSYPRPIDGDRLVATCAIEGTLDLYELPANGIVPANWTAEQIWNTHRSSRTHADRILLLNSLRYRFPSQISEADVETRLLSNHMLAGDSAAARFYAQDLRSKSKSSDDSALFDLTDILLAARELKNVQKGPEITREFAQAIAQLDAEAAKIKTHPEYRDVIRGSLALLLNRPAQAEAFWKKAKWTSAPHPLERQIWFELGEKLLSGPGRTQELLAIFGTMVGAPELSHENHVYFTVRLLEAIEARISNRAARIAELTKWEGRLAQPYSDLVRVEEIAQRLISESDETAKRKIWDGIDKILRQDRKKDYFTLKAMLTRGLVLFDAANEYRYVNLIAGLWLSLNSRADSEFAHGREIVAQAQLDRGYDALSKDNKSLAPSYFYGSLLLTDDLESHSSYIRSMVRHGQRETIDLRYASIEKENFIGDNRLFVKALLILLDAEPELAANPSETGPFDRALDLLEKMQDDRDSAIRHLLMGYCKLQKLERQGKGYDLDRGLFEEAHRHFMLTLDQARDNPRVTAAALMDLGILHARVQNHGLAVRFFKRRQTFGFMDANEEAGFTWLLTRSLLRNYQEADAGAVLQGFLASPQGKSLSTMARAPFEERLAFAHLLSGENEWAAREYDELLKRGVLSGNENLAKIRFARGRALFRAGKTEAAREELVRALGLIDQAALESGPHPFRFTGWEPRRLQLMITGLLAQMGGESQRLEALSRRVDLLKNAEDILDEWNPMRMLANVQLATSKRIRSDATAIENWKTALEASKAQLAYAKVVDTSILNTVRHLLVDGVLMPASHAAIPIDDVRGHVDRIRELLDKALFPQPEFDLARLELELLWKAYDSARSGRHDFASLHAWEGLQSLGAWKRLAESPTGTPEELSRLNRELLQIESHSK